MSEYEDAIENLNDGNYEEAIEKFEKCLDQGENTEDCNYNLSRCYFGKGEYQAAERYIKKALDDNPEKNDYLYVKGLILNNLNRKGEALEVFNKMTEIDEDCMEGFRGAGIALYQMRRYYEAKPKLAKAIYINNTDRGNNPPDLITHQTFISVAGKLEQYNDIIEDIDDNELLDHYPEDRLIINGKALALCEKGERDELVEFCQEKLDDERDLEYYIAKFLYNEEKYRDAITMLDKAIKKDVQNSESYYLYGEVLKKLNEPDKKIRICFERCIKYNPENIDAYLQVAQIYLDYQEYEVVEKVIKEAEKHIDKKYQKKYELLELLFKIDLYCKLKRRAEAKEEIKFVREVLNDEKITDFYSKKKLIEIYYKYFEIYHLCKYLYTKDLKDIDGKMIDQMGFGENEDGILGKGGFGKVYRGTLFGDVNNLKKDVAIKEFFLDVKAKNRNEENEDEDNSNLEDERLSEEERTFSTLNSIFKEITYMEILSEKTDYVLNVISIFFERSWRKVIMVTPLLEGGNLYDLIYKKEKHPSIKARITILLQVAEAIKSFQQSDPPLTHNDLKLSNIMLVKKFKDGEENPQIKLIDFGSMAVKNRDINAITIQYAAPEFLDENSVPGTPADIYSFGVVCWSCFSREKPFGQYRQEEISEKIREGERPDINLVEKDTPVRIKNLITECFKEDPDDRPTIDKIIKELKDE